MITVSLIKELFFIAAFIKREVWSGLSCGREELPFPLKVRLKPDGELDVWYRGHHIWNENVEGESSFFGVESCDSIARIIACIDNNDNSWLKKYYFSEKKALT